MIERARSKKLDPLGDIESLEEGLQIDENNLDGALLQQPDLYWRVSKQLALAISLRDQAKQDLATIEASTEMYIRRQLVRRKEKTTESDIKSQVRLHDDVAKAQDELRDRTLEAAQWQALERSYDQRMSALKKLVDLYLKNYFMESGLSSSSSSMKDYNAYTAKQVMAEERRRRS